MRSNHKKADDIFEIMTEYGISKKKAIAIIQKYVDIHGLLGGNKLVN